MPIVDHVPHYQVDIKAHLPVDPPWRDTARNVRRTTISSGPMEVWRNAIVDMASVLGFGGDPAFFIGLMLETINPWPPEIRSAMAHGIINGLGMTLMEDNGGISGSLDPKFPTLTPPDIETPGVPEGMVALSSGLVIAR